MAEPIAYLKGKFVPASQCTLAIYDLGVVMGSFGHGFPPDLPPAAVPYWSRT